MKIRKVRGKGTGSDEQDKVNNFICKSIYFML